MKYFKRLMITLCTAFYFCLSSCNYLNVDEYFADTLGYDSIFQNYCCPLKLFEPKN